MAVARLGVIEVSHDLLAEWLHLPLGVIVDAVAAGDGFYSFIVRLRSDDNEFLPEVQDGEKIPTGSLVITRHEPTVEFQVHR